MIRKSGVLLASILFFAMASSAGAAELKRTSLMLQWLPQAQFAGYFVAKQKGFYEELGLDVEIISGGPDKMVTDCMDSGKTEFGTMFLSTAMERRSGGMPIVNIAQIVQDSALMLIAKKSANITNIIDLNGQRVSMWANEFQLQPRALFRKRGIEVRIVQQSGSMDLFLRDAVSATSAMWYNEYHRLINYGLDSDELTLFFFRDHGLNIPEDGIYTMQDTLEKKPEICKALVEATIKGWMYAFEHEEEALDIVEEYMSREKVPSNRIHQKWMLERMKDIILQNRPAMDVALDPKGFDLCYKTLEQSGLIENAIKFADFFREVTRD